MTPDELVPGPTLSPLTQRILAIDSELASLDQSTFEERLMSGAATFVAVCLLLAVLILILHLIVPEYAEYAWMISLAIAFAACTEPVQRYLSEKGRRRLRLERELTALTREELKGELPQGGHGARGPAQPSA